MKKFLSLVLALVMTMSLVTVSAGAKDFTDASKITYDEAVAVMSAAKVIDGYAEGDFRPTNTLTRGAAAKIICNLILGPTTASALVADAAPYKDVPTTNTFAGYIAYCAKEGIISGYADGTFKPANTLTGYAFMKMLLGALGYDVTAEGYTGANWSINVAKRALNVGLSDDLVGEPMTTAKAVAELGKVDSKVKTTGVTLELFCTKNHVDTVVAYFYKVAKIADVDDNVTKADARDDVTFYVELKDVDTFNDNDIVGFDAKTYVKDAYVAYIAKGDEIIDSYIADEVEGSLTTIKGNDYATMSGTKYSVVKASGADVSDFKTGSDNTYKLFLDKNGYVIGTKTVDEDANLDEIYYVALTWSETSNSNAAKTQYYAQLVDLTGKVTEVETEISYSNLNNKLVTTSDKKWTSGDTTYKAKNGKLDLKEWNNSDYNAQVVANYSGWKFTKDMTRFVTNVGTYRFNSSTQYVLIGGTGSDIEANVKTGDIALTGTKDMKGYVITEDDSKVSVCHRLRYFVSAQ